MPPILSLFLPPPLGKISLFLGGFHMPIYGLTQAQRNPLSARKFLNEKAINGFCNYPLTGRIRTLFAAAHSLRTYPSMDKIRAHRCAVELFLRNLRELHGARGAVARDAKVRERLRSVFVRATQFLRHILERDRARRVGLDGLVRVAILAVVLERSAMVVALAAVPNDDAFDVEEVPADGASIELHHRSTARR